MDVVREIGDQARSGRIHEYDELAGKQPSGAAHMVDYPGDEPLPSKADDGEWTIERMTADPDGWARAHKAKWKAANPQMTDEQLENNWLAARQQIFGY